MDTLNCSSRWLSKVLLVIFSNPFNCNAGSGATAPISFVLVLHRSHYLKFSRQLGRPRHSGSPEDLLDCAASSASQILHQGCRWPASRSRLQMLIAVLKPPAHLFSIFPDTALGALPQDVKCDPMDWETCGACTKPRRRRPHLSTIQQPSMKDLLWPVLLTAANLQESEVLVVLPMEREEVGQDFSPYGFNSSYQ